MIKDNSQLLHQVTAIAKQAGEAILAIYNSADDLSIQRKIDNSPITQADLNAHNIIINGLKKLDPDMPVLSEESDDIPYHVRQQWQRYWLVDPMDGTKEFIEHTGEFSVLIALIEHHQPVLGVIYAPVLQECFYAARGHGAFCESAQGKVERIKVRKLDQCLHIIASRRHGVAKFAPFIKDFSEYKIVNRGSALKFAAIATGEADIYPRFGETSEWDSAAGQCIVEEAGGKVMNLSGEVLQYNAKESLLNPEFIVVGDLSYDWLAALKKLNIR